MQDFKKHIHRRHLSHQPRKYSFKIEHSYGKKLKVTPLEAKNFLSRRFFTPPPAPSASSLTGEIPVGPLRTLFQRILGITAFIFVIWISFGIFFLSMDFFQRPLTKVIVRGNSLIRHSDLNQRIGLKKKTELIEIDPYFIANQINKHPLIQKADVRRIFPNALYINLTEYLPYASIKIRNHYFIIDRYQRLLKQVATSAAITQPVITGVSLFETRLGIPLDSPGIRQGIRLLDVFHQDAQIKFTVQEIDVTDPLNLKLKIHPASTIIQLGVEHYSEKIHLFNQMYPFLLSHYPNISMVDLRYHDKISLIP